MVLLNSGDRTATPYGQCAGPVYLAPHRILLGLAENVVAAASLIDCMTLCANARQLYQFTCTSGMFFADPDDNCILNSANRRTHSQFFVPANDDDVHYFEPGCGANGANAAKTRRSTEDSVQNRILTNAHEWGEWTVCNGGDRR